jgi:selT/selW/selH-like putative selenoprotein
VELQGGRRGSFEVTVDGEVIHSKLGSGEWPDTERTLEEIGRRLRR